ncbi:MAG: site-specific integrase [Pseudomonadota bacterium]
MPVLKLTKSVIDNAAPKKTSYELRDTEVKGFLCKVAPTGAKVYHVAYRTLTRKRRKLKIGDSGVYKVHEARDVARRWLQEVREGGDPAAALELAREELTVADLCDRFIRDHSELYNKASTTAGYRQQIAQRVLPALGAKKIGGVTRSDITALMRENAYAPTQANRTLALVKKMFNCTELWGLREEGTNPCRLVKMYQTKPKTRLLTDAEVKAIFEAMDVIEHDRMMAPVYTLACRLQFAFAARINEIMLLEWDWIDFERGLIRWPDSKTGLMEKYMDQETQMLIENAPSRGKSKYVCPAVTDPKKPLSPHTYYSSGWKRILKLAGVEHCGTHHVRHRAATDIANAVDNVRTGMQMTGHKTVQMFMRYIHPEEDRIRAAQAKIAEARTRILRTRNHHYDARS